MNKVNCPYCGTEMTVCADLCCGDIERYYYCPECQAQTPHVFKGSEFAAYAATMRKPTQKPMTLEEALEKRFVWLEERTPDGVKSPHVVFFKENTSKNRHLKDLNPTLVWLKPVSDESYGRYYRMWAERPTLYEREATEWLPFDTEQIT